MVDKRTSSDSPSLLEATLGAEREFLGSRHSRREDRLNPYLDQQLNLHYFFVRKARENGPPAAAPVAVDPTLPWP